jgi:HlyD family secretion protein
MKAWLLVLMSLLLAGCEEKKDTGWLGYGEGDSAYVAAPQPGWIEKLNVERGNAVKAGDLLFVLDTTAQEASRSQAEATLAETEASLKQEQSNLAYTRTELTRQNGLARANAGTPAQRDQALTNYQQSQARVAQLKAQIAQMQASLSGASYSLSQRSVVAQTDGPVQDIYFRPGEYVPASTPVVSILPPANIYVRFFVPQSELAGVKLGDQVEVNCDGCRPMRAKITFIAAQVEFTPPVIFSVENLEKLVFKLEARAAGGIAIHPGQPVTVKKV